MLISHLYVFNKVSVKVFGPFFKIELFDFLLLCIEYSCVFQAMVLFQMCFCKLFFTVCGVSSYSLDIVFPRTKGFFFFFNLMRSSLSSIYYLFILFIFIVISFH